jgi:protein phosphatase
VYLRSIAKTANARIHRLAESDSSRSGMGTTFTAALLEGEEIGFAHVGDSRAYLFRAGELKLLTSDHSLVEELRRQGRLTDEQAEDHPQRSIITRALGPERDVEVDTMTYRARPGDVYLLCSDGLTTMIKEDRIAAIMAESKTLDQAVDQLVSEANEAGGRDNITVVAFRVDEAEVPAERPEDLTLVGPAAEEAGLTAAGVEEAAERQRAATRERERVRGPGRRERRWPRRVVRALVIVIVTLGLVALAVWGVRQVYFLGADSGGRLALYRGLPYDLPFGIHLYSEVYSAPVQVNSVPQSRRDSATNHTLRFHDDAVSLLDDLQTAAERKLAARQPSKETTPGSGKQGGGARNGTSPKGSGSGGGGGSGGAGGAKSGGNGGGAG